MNSTEITVTELQSIVSSGEAVVIAEILPAKYYESGHIPGARHLPLDGFETTAKTVAPNKEGRVVVYCASATCTNSDIAARKLGEMGYTNVRVFKGGKAAWTDAGLALATMAAS
jgi:rhodanese-related sulfurtransferase